MAPGTLIGVAVLDMRDRLIGVAALDVPDHPVEGEATAIID